jgi:hypothetical protein
VLGCAQRSAGCSSSCGGTAAGARQLHAAAAERVNRQAPVGKDGHTCKRAPAHCGTHASAHEASAVRSATSPHTGAPQPYHGAKHESLATFTFERPGHENEESSRAQKRRLRGAERGRTRHTCACSHRILAEYAKAQTFKLPSCAAAGLSPFGPAERPSAATRPRQSQRLHALSYPLRTSRHRTMSLQYATGMRESTAAPRLAP